MTLRQGEDIQEIIVRDEGDAGPADLYPGVRRAGVLLWPEGRPPRAGVKVHIIGSCFQSMRLGAVVNGRWIGDDLL